MVRPGGRSLGPGQQEEFTCEDGETRLAGSQVCDGLVDCPVTETGPGGEDEEGCEGSGAKGEESRSSGPLRAAGFLCKDGITLISVDRVRKKEDEVKADLWLPPGV